IGIAGTFILRHWPKRRQAATGEQFPVLRAGIGLVVVLPLLVFLVLGAPFTLEKPELRGFNFVGGATLSPGFAALLIGLVTYTAAFIAEIVRSGILAVSH